MIEDLLKVRDPKPTKFRVIDDRSKEIAKEGKRLKSLAVSFDLQQSNNRYIVTHLPTGKTVTQFLSEESAIKFLKVMSHYPDWESDNLNILSRRFKEFTRLLTNEIHGTRSSHVDRPKLKGYLDACKKIKTKSKPRSKMD